MNNKSYIISYMRKLTVVTFVNLFCLYYLINIYATETPLNHKELDLVVDNNKDYSDTKIRLADDLEEQNDEKISDFPPEKLARYLPKNSLDKNIFYSLDRILHKDGFDLKNGNWWLLKALICAPTPFFCGANTLILAQDTVSLTPKSIIAAQFIVPRTIEIICGFVDKLRLAIIAKSVQIWWNEKIAKNYYRGLPLLAWMLIKVGAGMYLTYSYSLIDAKNSGDAYRAIYSDITTNKKALDIHKNIGYFFNFSYISMLGTVFFFQLIDEFAAKCSFICITIYNYCRGNQPENQELKYGIIHDTITDLRATTELVCKYDNSDEQIDYAIEEYLSDRGLNSMNDIASLQKYLSPENKPSSIAVDIASNIFKLVFIAGATVLCGISFKYIFASETILREYVKVVGKQYNRTGCDFQVDPNVPCLFSYKNGSYFSCNSVKDCTNGVDFSEIKISSAEKDKLSDLSKIANLASALQGVAVSSDTAVLILSIMSLSHSFIYSYLHRRAFKIGLFENGRFRTSKIIPFIGGLFIFPAMVFYLDNVNNVKPVAKTDNKLLEAIGETKGAFIPVDLGIAAAIGVLGVTFSLGARLLSNIPNAVYAIPSKIMVLPASTKKLCTDISRWYK